MWTGMEWIAIPGGHSPAVPPVTNGEYGTSGTTTNAYLEGWSRGYVEFVWNPHTRTAIPWVSADGLDWKAGADIANTSSWKAYFSDYDAENPGTDPAFHDACSFSVDNFQEGPGGRLLIAASVDCSGPGMCLGAFDSWTTEDQTWTSQDGLTWVDEALPSGIDGGNVFGGPSGFVALGIVGSKATVLVSQDGHSWTEGALPAAALAAGSTAWHPVSFSGGFVLPGEVPVKTGPGAGGCTGGDTDRYEGAVWWSPDGKTWTRDSLTGANPTDSYHAMMNVVRIDDHTIVAGEFDSKTEWVSSNGKTWATVKGTPVVFKAYGQPGNVVAGKDRGLVMNGGPYAFNDKLTLVALKQSGDLPWKGVQYVLGPTGLLATDGGNRFWIGAPTAG
jgi:hypothetical protein